MSSAHIISKLFLISCGTDKFAILCGSNKQSVSSLSSWSRSSGFHGWFKKASSTFQSDVIYWSSGRSGRCICATSVVGTEISEWKDGTMEIQYENYPGFPQGSCCFLDDLLKISQLLSCKCERHSNRFWCVNNQNKQGLSTAKLT